LPYEGIWRYLSELLCKRMIKTSVRLVDPFTCHTILFMFCICMGCRGHDRMVVGFTTTCAISAYHHWCCWFESRSGRGVQHYMIKFVSDLQQVGGFLRGSSGFLHQCTVCHYIAEILLKEALNTIKQANKN
jgi:hypothetical protein